MTDDVIKAIVAAMARVVVDDVIAVAVALWREDARRAAAPPSVIAGRTAEAFKEESEDTRARYVGFAIAAMTAMHERGRK